VESADRERERWNMDILLVKKESKRSASEEGDVVVGRGDADLR